MPQTHRLSARLLALVAAVQLLAGCSSSPSPSTSTSTATATTTSSASSTATTAACTAADALVHALTSFKDSLKAGATVDQVRSARDQVVKTYNDLNTALGTVASTRLDAVKSAEARLDAAVKAIPDDATLTQALDSLKQEAKDVQAALSDLLADINC